MYACFFCFFMTCIICVATFGIHRKTWASVVIEVCTFSSDNWFIDARFRKCVEKCPTNAVVFDWTKRTCEVCDDDSTNHDCLTSMYLKIKSKYLRGYGMNFYFHNIQAPFLPHAHSSSKFTKLSFILYGILAHLWAFSQKKVFSAMCHIGGIPTRRNDFFPKNRSRRKLHRFHFSIFFKRRC